MIWNLVHVFVLLLYSYYCVINFHHQYYSVPHSVSSYIHVPQSRRCVSVRSESEHVPSLCQHYSVISGKFGILTILTNILCS